MDDLSVVLKLLINIAPLLTVILALLALWQARQLFEEQSKFAKRQMFVPLFESFKGIRTIDCKKSKPEEIVNMINFMELLGVLYESDVVDRDIVVRAFQRFVIHEYAALEKCQEALPEHTKSGAEMLNESPSAKSLYQAMQEVSTDG